MPLESLKTISWKNIRQLQKSIEDLDATAKKTRMTLNHSLKGLGIVPGEQSFFHENERNDQELSQERLLIILSSFFIFLTTSLLQNFCLGHL